MAVYRPSCAASRFESVEGPVFDSSSILCGSGSYHLRTARQRAVTTMRPLGWIGVVLIAAGAVVLAMRGLSYTKERQEVNVGPVGVSAERKGFIPPVAGAAAVAVGVILVFAGRKRKA